MKEKMSPRFFMSMYPKSTGCMLRPMIILNSLGTIGSPLESGYNLI